VPELSVILVNFNDRQNLETCLHTLFEVVRREETEILVVDNASSDGSPEMVRRRFPRTRLIENKKNVGFARANNQGLMQTEGPLVLFLNTDAKVNAGALELLMEEMLNNPQAGGVGPALKKRKDSYQVSFGRKVDFFYAFFQKAVLNPYYTWRLKSDSKKREVGWLSAACLLIRREAVEEAGFFDERFFLYFEDIDLCYRMRGKGWKLFFLPRARMSHAGGTSTSSVKHLSRYHYRRSQIDFYRKHNSGLSLFFLRWYLRLVFCLSSWFKSLGQKEGKIDSRCYFELLKKGSG
jgi:GT2 family glycosyltransferase